MLDHETAGAAGGSENDDVGDLLVAVRIGGYRDWLLVLNQVC